MTDSQETSSETPEVHITGKQLLAMQPSQVHALYKLRVDTFVNEQHTTFAEIDDADAEPGTHHVLAYVHPGHAPDYRWGTPDPGSPLRLVGTARIFGPAEEQQVGRLAVLPEFRGFGIARQIVDATLEVARGRAAALDPVTQTAIVKIDAQVATQPFYASYGFSPSVSPSTVEGIEHAGDAPHALGTAYTHRRE
ncbi:GNAT family N-acetyltransferase [Corynebacterium variabile]